MGFNALTLVCSRDPSPQRASVSLFEGMNRVNKKSVFLFLKGRCLDQPWQKTQDSLSLT